jgi:hypothetical protein
MLRALHAQVFRTRFPYIRRTGFPRTVGRRRRSRNLALVDIEWDRRGVGLDSDRLQRHWRDGGRR